VLLGFVYAVNVIVTVRLVDDFTTSEHPNRVIKFSQVAAFNNFDSQDDNNTVSVPWSWNDSGDILVNLDINLPPL
jgi:hypothetical protein